MLVLDLALRALQNIQIGSKTLTVHKITVIILRITMRLIALQKENVLAAITSTEMYDLFAGISDDCDEEDAVDDNAAAIANDTSDLEDDSEEDGSAEDGIEGCGVKAEENDSRFENDSNGNTNHLPNVRKIP